MKPEALRLADALIERHGTESFQGDAAAELRRLHAQRDALLKALRMMRAKYGEYACSACDYADAVIAAGKEGK